MGLLTSDTCPYKKRKQRHGHMKIKAKLKGMCLQAKDRWGGKEPQEGTILPMIQRGERMGRSQG